MLIASAMFMVACDEETTVSETTDVPQEDTVSAAETEATAGSDLPSNSSASDSAAAPSSDPEKTPKSIPTSAEVKAATEASADEETPDWIKQQSPVLEAGTLNAGADIEVDYTELSEFEMLRYEAIETAIAEDNLTFVMGYCYQSSCRETYYTFLNQLNANDAETAYDLEVLTTAQFADEPARWEINPYSTQVLCSTYRPMVIDFDGTEYTVNHISAGSPQIYPFAGLQEPDAIYWQVCHGLENPLPSEIPTFAESYGYDLTTESRVTQQDFIELIETEG